MILKYKIINHIMQKGKKIKSEKLLNKILKVLQKTSKKPTKELIQLTVLLFSKIFKINNIKKKNRKTQIIPVFINDKKKRFAFSIKSILFAAKNNYLNYLHYNLTEKFFLIAQRKNELISFQKNLEKQVISKKYFLKYYRWKNL